MKLPIGRDEFSCYPWYTKLAKAAPVSILGWLITAFAISFGAPFWFDLLNKLMVVRSSVKPGEKSSGQKQPDHQCAKQPS